MNCMDRVSALSKDLMHAEIDAAIDEWHASDSTLSLHEYLGLTWDEYKQWVENPECLESIVVARSNGHA